MQAKLTSTRIVEDTTSTLAYALPTTGTRGRRPRRLSLVRRLAMPSSTDRALASIRRRVSRGSRREPSYARRPEPAGAASGRPIDDPGAGASNGDLGVKARKTRRGPSRCVPSPDSGRPQGKAHRTRRPSAGSGLWTPASPPGAATRGRRALAHARRPLREPALASTSCRSSIAMRERRSARPIRGSTCPAARREHQRRDLDRSSRRTVAQRN